MQTECLVIGGPGTTISVSVRFLQLVGRLVGQFADAPGRWPAEGAVPCPIVECLRVGDEVFYTWQEAVEQAIDLGESNLAALAVEPRRREFVLEPQRDRQPLRDPEGMFVGELVRERRRVEGLVELSAARGCCRGISGDRQDRKPDTRSMTASAPAAMKP